jgi:hypothetical protein
MHAAQGGVKYRLAIAIRAKPYSAGEFPVLAAASVAAQLTLFIVDVRRGADRSAAITTGRHPVLAGHFAARSIFMKVAATGVRWRPATP